MDESEREKEVYEQNDDASKQEEVEVRVTRGMHKKMKLELENRRREIKMLAQQQKMESEQPSERKQDVPSSSAVIGIERERRKLFLNISVFYEDSHFVLSDFI